MKALYAVTVIALSGFLPGTDWVAAQDTADAVALPDPKVIVAVLANRETRDEAILTTLVIQRLFDKATPLDENDRLALLPEFSSERNRLNRVAGMNKYHLETPAQQDLAGQVLIQELAQHGLRLWSDEAASHVQLKALAAELLFSSERLELAAGVLPMVMADTEINAVATWARMNDQLSTDPGLGLLLNALPADTWSIFKVVDQGELVGSDINEVLERLAADTINESPPDPQVLTDLRKLILQTDNPDVTQNRALLGLAGAIDGLHDHQYLQFAHYLLGMSFELIEQHTNAPEGTPAELPVASVALHLLPGISAAYAREFAAVDPRINSTIAAVFDALDALTSDAAINAEILRRGLTDALAQMLLLVPDAAYYFDQPVRHSIREEINICTSILAVSEAETPVTISREQFDGCIESFNDLIDGDARDSALSGNSSGPFESEQLRRELSLPGWQRINYTLGFLSAVTAANDCEIEGPDIVNPLEWSLLASTFRWFADQRPVYFQTPESEQQLELLITAGEHLIDQMRAQADCFALAEGADSVNRAISLYRLEINELLEGVNEVEGNFRATNFKSGADADFTADALQPTTYRPDEITIGPCTTAQSCEMADELSATRALVSLFPSPYLIADQSRMGNIEICYANVHWRNRRSEVARKNDPQVANYFGNFAFELKGRFKHGGQVDDVFAMSLQSPDEHHYFFGANDAAILDKPCPIDLVGTSIITELIGSGLPIVPNRLTYLTAARTLPSWLFAENWEAGAEWRDWFITGTGVAQLLQTDGAELIDPVNTHLQQLLQQSESSVYTALVSQPLRFNGESNLSLAEQVSDVSRAKSLVRAVITLFGFDTLQSNDIIRGGLEGNNGLLDNRTIRRLRDSATPVSQLSGIAQSRLQEFQRAWNREPEALRRAGIISKPVLMSYLQLLDLRRRYFPVGQAVPEQLESIDPADAEPATSPESSTPPPGQAEPESPDAEPDSTSSP